MSILFIFYWADLAAALHGRTNQMNDPLTTETLSMLARLARALEEVHTGSDFEIEYWALAQDARELSQKIQRASVAAPLKSVGW